MTSPLQPTDLDRQIWQDELDEFVPLRVFDAHSHIYRWAFNQDPNKQNGPLGSFIGDQYAEASWEFLENVDRQLMPGRQVERLSFPFPFPHPCDFAASNDYIAGEVRRGKNSAALMLVHPGMTADELEAQIEQHGFLGFKPYRFYSSTGDAVECRITDFLPEHQIEVADRHGLLIMMHLSKRRAVADEENLSDLERLCQQYPNARWILAHCARSYSAWAVERAGSVLRRLNNVWYDTSSVCESDAVEALCNEVGMARVMYGSDDVPVGVMRGKYVAFGYAWAYLSESNHSFNLSHCDPRMTFTRYEQLRAMRRATIRLGLSRRDVEALFYDTAANLIADVRKNIPSTA